MELPLAAFQTFATEAAPTGLMVNYGKTKIQSLSHSLSPIQDLYIDGERVEAVIQTSSTQVRQYKTRIGEIILRLPEGQ